MKVTFAKCFLATSLLSTSLYAQKVTDALAAAYKNNNNLEASRQKVKSSNEQITQAMAGYFPEITAEIGKSLNRNTETGDKKSPGQGYFSTRQSSNYGALKLKQNIYKGGATKAAVSESENNIKANWYDFYSAEQNLFLNVINSYLSLLAKKAKVNVYKANLEANKKAYETSVEKQKVGEETVTQVAQAEVRLIEAETSLRSAMADLKNEEANFQSLTGIEPLNIEQPKASIEDLPSSLKEIIEIAFEHNPSLQKAQYQHLQSQSSLDKTKATDFPSIDLQAQSHRNEANTRGKSFSGGDIYGRGIGDLKDSKNSNYTTSHSVTLSMSYPLYAGGQYQSQKRQAHDAMVSARVSIDDVKSNLQKDIQSTYENMLSAKDNVVKNKKSVEANQTLLESITQEMQVGTKVLKDVLDAQASLVQSKLSVIQSELEYLLSIYKLKALMGQLTAKALQLPVELFDPQVHYQNVRVGY